MNEVWCDITDYTGLYKISSLGRIKGLPRYKKPVERILKGRSDTRGYRQVKLRKDSIDSAKMVHRLVAEAFIPNPLGKPQVNHIDGNKSNNCVENLEWVTQSENVLHAYRVLKRKHPYNAGRARKKCCLVNMESGLMCEFNSISEASRAINSPLGNLIKVLKGELKRCKGWGGFYA